MIKAFGVAVFTGQGNSKSPPVAVEEINQKLSQLGVTDENVISIQKDEEFYHVFYRAT